MTPPLVHVIVFSKDRPLQLHGYLTSLCEQWHGAYAVDVLARPEPPYAEAYAAVAAACAGRASFCWEEDFALDVLRLVDETDAPLTCFGTDDAVFVAPVAVPALPPLFAEDRRLLGVSFRLGFPIRRGMFGQEMAHPPFLAWAFTPGDPTPPPAAMLAWDATAPGATGDWAYPWDVVGTVYRTDYVRRLVASLAGDGLCTNPSTLEHHGAARWQHHADGATLLRAWATPRLVLPTVNVVQSEFGNGIVGPSGIDPAFLLECWQRGLRVDTWRYAHTHPQPDTWRTGDLYLHRRTA